MTGIITAVFASSGIWSLILYLVQRRDSKKSADKKADAAAAERTSEEQRFPETEQLKY